VGNAMNACRSCWSINLGLLILLSSAGAHAALDCGQLPAPDPGKNFFSNFLNNCYAIPLALGDGVVVAGDTNALYDVLYYRVDPRYEVVFVGAFPNARSMSVAVYDDHEATLHWLTDYQIVPMSPSFVNPYQPGVAFVPDQRYAVVVGLGGVQPLPDAVTPGCRLDMFNVHVNSLDASMRHTGLSWDGDPGIPAWFPPHETGANTAGAILFRRYLYQSAASPLAKPIALLRDLTTGCAVPATEATQVLQQVTADRRIYTTWVHRDQEDAHWYYVNQVLPRMCYGVDPDSYLLWLRGAEYLPGTNPDAVYLAGQFKLPVAPPPDWFMRIRLRLPRMPQIPCLGCTLDGTEELRYWSVSFQNKNFTIASFSDRDVVVDAEGFATIIIGLGTPAPSHLTPENGYTYFDLTQYTDWNKVTALNIRSILRSPGFRCSSGELSPRTGEYNSLGGFMGEYSPAVDFLTSTQIPPVAEPYRRPDSCEQTPPEAPVPCTAFYGGGTP